LVRAVGHQGAHAGLCTDRRHRRRRRHRVPRSHLLGARLLRGKSRASASRRRLHAGLTRGCCVTEEIPPKPGEQLAIFYRGDLMDIASVVRVSKYKVRTKVVLGAGIIESEWRWDYEDGAAYT